MEKTKYTPRTKSVRARRNGTGLGFQVTVQQVIGEVVASPTSDQDPLAAAFGLISDYVVRNGVGGTFSFPGPFENEEPVQVVIPGPQG